MAEHDDREQRTEDATPRRREEARERGQVALSSELVAGVGLVGGLGALLLGGGNLVRAVAESTGAAFASLGRIGTQELEAARAAELLASATRAVAVPLLAVVLPVTALVALAAYAQVGLRLAPQAVSFDPSKLDPLRGLRRMFSMRSALRAGLSLLKVAGITAAVAAVAWSRLDEILAVSTNELGPLLAALGRVAFQCALAAASVILALGLVDLVVQRFQHARDLRMTKKEVQEERRLTDGDPHVRARIRQIQREIARRRMLADVPKATVIVTNPTHVAVALRYEAEERAAGGAAPVVVAKGVDHLALRIRGLAEEHGVVCHEDVPLARALYAQVRVGQQIPEELYAAVAAVLTHVYRLRGRPADLAAGA